MCADAATSEKASIPETVGASGTSVQVPVPSFSTSPSILSDTQQIQTPTSISVRQTSTLIVSVPAPPEELSPSSTLAKHGIKVRDFAYESTLPPIAPVPRVPRQIQPGPRPLKRARKDYDENDDDPFVQRNAGGPSNIERNPSRKFKPLERQLTEPDIPNSQRPVRPRGFPDISLREPSVDIPPRPHTPVQFPTRVPFVNADLSPCSQPPLQPDSQESEPYVDTPIVTPNGSLQWPVVDNSAVPASQLDRDSLMPAPVLASYSQLGFTRSLPSDELSQRDTSPVAPNSPTALSSPLSEAPSYPCLPICTNNHDIPSQRPPPPPHRHTQPAPQSPQRPTSPTAPSRYFLRKRPATTTPHTTPRQSRSQARHTPATASPRQQHSFTMQSAHARAKSQNLRVSSRSRTRRKDANGKEDSVPSG